ncbi:RNA polymerase sigma factor [Kitasatospora sp. NPDC048298]|uniref:RNA polymerase sigma factor n=1 Tax=Kitasatospora sp. NPDC048298 TaxID=3364049 RepID=UPI0037231431
MNDREPSEGGIAPGLSALPGPGGPQAATGTELPVQEQFAAFYRGFTPRLVGFLMWQGAPGQVAADLAQEAMISAYRGWRDIRSPEAWTRKVASRGLVRHFSRVEEDPVSQVPEVVNALLPRPDELAEWENTQVLTDLLHGLPPRQRQVLAWSVSGYSPSEIAEELALDPAAVRANLLKARRAVARHMKAGEEDS